MPAQQNKSRLDCWKNEADDKESIWLPDLTFQHRLMNASVTKWQFFQAIYMAV